MNTTIRVAVLATSIAALSACGVIHPEVVDQSAMDYQGAKAAPDKGSAFQRSLHQGYADFGRWEFQQADFRDTKYYTDRANLTANGQTVQPVVLSERALASPYQGELVNGRARLMQVVGNTDTTARVPGPAGAAQVYFDCWAEQAEEGHQPEHIAYCKNGFDTAMGQVTPAPMAQLAPQPAPAVQAARPYIVFFDWDKATLAPSSDTTMNEIATQISRSNPSTIRIAGHADKSGTNMYNDALSKRRADAVRATLEQRGVARTKSTTEAFGESRPLVNTADDVREPQNRRVEVILQ